MSATEIWTMDNNYSAEQWKFMEEMCILVDENDKQVGFDSKKNCHLINKEDNSTKCHRAFSVFLFNSENKLLLQKRSDKKITFPLYWANTCCSHPLNITGETETKNSAGVKRAAIRKLNHELGVPLDTFSIDDFTDVLTVHYSAPSDEKWGENEVDHILVVKKDIEFNINDEEVDEARYFSVDEVFDLLDHSKETGEKVSPWFEKISRYYLRTIADHIDSLNSIAKNDIVYF